MAAHTLLGGKGSTTAKQTADLGVSRVGQFGDKYDVVQVKNGEAATALYFKGIVASNKGYVKMKAIPGDEACVVIADGISVPDIYEFDIGVRPTGTITIAIGNAATGDEITIDDGVNAPVIFEFDDGVIGNDGELTIAVGNVADGNTVTAWGHTYEFDGGVAATGTIEFICQPADGQTLTLDDGTNAPTVFEFDDDASVGAGNVSVTIGASFIATATALHTAINAVGAGLTVTSADDTAGTLTITNDAVGSAAAQNTPIVTTSHAVVLAGMLGGLEPGFGPVTGTNTAVAIGADANASATNLLAAIVADTTELAAGSSVTGGSGETLFVWDSADSAYNTTITKVGANITIDHQPSNGATPGTNITAGSVGVAVGATNLISTANLLAAIQGQKTLGNLEITATPSTPPDNVVNLRNDNYGTAGNILIVETGANISCVGMLGGVAVGTPTGTHIGVARAATAAGCLTNLSAAIVAHGSAVVTPGTQYTEVDTSGTTWYVLPISGTHRYDYFVIDQDTTSYAAGNMIVSVDDTEYKMNGIGVFQMDGNYYDTTHGWREFPYVAIQAKPANTVQLTRSDLYSAAVPASTGTYMGIGRSEWAMVGDIAAKIIVVPRLDTAATTHGAFAAGGDVITAFGVVTNR